MFSPLKAIIAGALVFALGGLYLADQQETAVPGAEMVEPPIAVSVGTECGNVLEVPVVCTWTASDPRLTGRHTHEWITPKIVDGQVTADLSDDGVRVGWADAQVEGPEGDRIGYQYAVWSDDPTQLFILLSGHGAYEAGSSSPRRSTMELPVTVTAPASCTRASLRRWGRWRTRRRDHHGPLIPARLRGRSAETLLVVP